ncbi:sensor histidine kinase [Elstera litoralis]|uniref:sensor histidine kinase n=1 Tax=Elstera litoralis TaxID=552518 RepID=UPI0018DDD429|nr:HAMP domain-containing sensor histidine kinase [Elstera litoralis]
MAFHPLGTAAHERSALSRGRFNRIARRAVWSAGISGALWGSACLLTRNAQPLDQFVVALVVAALVSGSATTLAALPRTAYAFVTMCLLPWIFFFAWQGGSYLTLSLLAAVYWVALIFSIQRVNGTYRQAIVAQGSQIRLSRHLSRLREEWLAVASVTDAVALFDEAGRLVLWNSAMTALLEAPPAQGMSFQAFLALSLWQEQAIAATPPGQWSADYALGDGRYLQTILAQKGAWRVLCHRDISPLKARELSLEAERARAVRADRAKSTFLATMSHELRTPLNAIMGFSEVIRDQYVTDPRRVASYAGDIHQSAAHLLAIINDILDIARIENAEIILHRRPIPMRALLDETARISSGLARRQGVSVLYRGGEDWPLVIGDRTRLAQSICNFLSNGIKASQSGQIVEMLARISDEHRYLLTIRDTGPGIPPERLGDLFRPFATFDDRDAYRSAGDRGTGLGLAITKELLDAHGISITVDTQVGTGTAITLDFTPCVELVRDEPVDELDDQSGEGT